VSSQGLGAAGRCPFSASRPSADAVQQAAAPDAGDRGSNERPGQAERWSQHPARV